ncbi:MAG: hypothetical protein IIA87_03115 [Nanoarchaeota archaeon]|nr:hypothetical protein [Nanoarchaeota archaeon]
MVKKRGRINFLSILLTLIILIALVHTTLHIMIYGTGISGLGESGISGLAIGKFALFEGLKENYSNMSPISKIFIAGEWIFVIVIIVITLIKGKIELKKDIQSIKINLNEKSQYAKSKSKTDLDVLYDILKEKKMLRMSAISKLFGVNKNTVMDWCKILEEGDLATVKYPTVGEPEIILNEK